MRRGSRQGGEYVGHGVRAYIGLGSNVGEPAATLARAVAALGALPGARLGGVSRLYTTAPVGVLDQPDFSNAVVALDVRAGPDPEAGALALLRQLKVLEARFGRMPGQRWGPRLLDLDLLLFGRARILVERPPDLASHAMPTAGRDSSAPGGAPADDRLTTGRDSALPPQANLLQVPHRDIGDRLFVLAPLSDLAPRLVVPGWRETVTTARLRREQLEGPTAARLVGTWKGPSKGWI